MSTDRGHEDPHRRRPDRAEEMFDVLASSRGRAPVKVESTGNPWKVASIVLLVLALVMPLAYGIRESRRQIDREERLQAAREEVAETKGLLEIGNLPEAVLALHDVGMKLAPVEGAEEAALAVQEAVERMAADLEEERERSARRAQVEVVVLRALQSVLDGDAATSARLLEPVLRESKVAQGLKALVERIAELDRAARESVESRTAILGALASDWPLPGVESLSREAGEEAGRARDRTEGVVLARAALARGAADEARGAIRRALVAGRLEGAEGILAGIRRRERLDRAERLEAEGNVRAAAALYRTVAVEGGDPAAVRSAVDLEDTLDRESLRNGLAEMADRAARGGDLAAAAALYGASARLSSGKDEELATRIRGRWLRTMAQEYRQIGELEAALVHAREAADVGDVPARGLVADIEAAIARRNDRTLVERAEAALRDGAATHAARLIEGVAAPGDLRRRIERGIRDEKFQKARALLFVGDGAGALELLDAARLRAAPEAAAEVGRALLLSGEVEAGLSRLPRDDEARVRALREVALRVAPREPVRAAALLTRCLEIGGPRADLFADLALALDGAGDPERAKPVWENLRDAALEKAPLPEEEPSDTGSGGR